jgi:hypothetical protein
MVDDSNHTVDELFQILVRARDMPPVRALDEIESALRLDKLRVTSRIQGGAVNYHGEIAPSEGLIVPVLCEGWRWDDAPGDRERALGGQDTGRDRRLFGGRYFVCGRKLGFGQ